LLLLLALLQLLCLQLVLPLDLLSAGLIGLCPEGLLTRHFLLLGTLRLLLLLGALLLLLRLLLPLALHFLCSDLLGLLPGRLLVLKLLLLL
jgi:hypothetical protein